MNRKARTALIAIAALFSSPTLAEETAPDAVCVQDARYRELDFTLGRWNVHDPEGRPTAVVEMEAVLGGCAIHENWYAADGVTLTGVGIFNYSRILDRWSYVWVSHDGASTIFTGNLVEPENMRFVTRRPGAAGQERLRHWSLLQLPDGRIRELSVGTENAIDGWSREYDLYWTKTE